MNIKIVNQEGKEVGQAAIPKAFERETNQALVHQALVWYQASARQGTHSTLTRAEVRGGGKKPWKQKGTGRARAGSTRSPLWRHGGVIFGPKPRDYSFSMPIKMRKAAIASIISDKARENKLLIVEAFELSAPKTKEVLKALTNLKIENQKNLVVVHPMDKNLSLGARNLKDTQVVDLGGINIQNLLAAQNLVVTKEALEKLGEKYASS